MTKENTWQDDLKRLKLYVVPENGVKEWQMDYDTLKAFISKVEAETEKRVREECVDMLKASPTGTLSRWVAVRDFLLCDDLKECPTCGSLKIPNPTPEGDEVCWSCGDREMLDYPLTK